MNNNTSLIPFISTFLKLESASGILLILAAILAMICANTGLQGYYELLLSTPVEVRVGALELAKPSLLWINDGLMAVFFFLVGLELKREVVQGELSNRANVVLPAFGALGGMLVPALIYYMFNAGDPVAVKGWAIPSATDIAFALGVLALLGSRVPTSLKVFLTSLAIIDDIGAILIIALFYTAQLSVQALTVALGCLIVLFLMNRLNATSKSLYIFVGLIMWVATLKSGVHATLAGVLVAMFIPMNSKKDPEISPLREMEHDLHPMVAFFILPLFAFANAGIDFEGMGFEQLFHNVPLGIALGLFFGNQIGVFGLSWLAIKTGLAKLPDGVSWLSLYGTASLCGIGFTMSFFIGSLAFEETGVNLLFDERLGILFGSIISGIVGYSVLRFSLKKA
jgi:NhaA family Na+:H+ antiporter